jgi:hypothetical protein
MTDSEANGDGEVVDELRRAREAELVREAGVWERLVDAHAQLVWDTVRLHALDTVEAARVCQLVWLRCADRFTVLARTGGVREWLVATAYGEAARAARAGRKASGTGRDAC